MLRDRSVASEGVEGTIPDSSAICLYIERKHPEPALYPADDYAYGRALWLEEYVDTDVANLFGLGMFRPMVMARLTGGEADPERARETLHEKLPPYFDYLEGIIGDREFMVGDRFGFADIAVGTQFVNFAHAGGKVDPARWPGLEAWVARTHARPSFAACIEEERKFLPPVEVEL